MSSSYENLSRGRYFDISLLEKLVHEWDLGSSIKEKMAFLCMNFQFLDMLLSFQSFTTECWDAVKFERINCPKDVESMLYKLKEQIREAKLEIKAKYSFPKASLPLSSNVATPQVVNRFVDTVVMNLTDLRKISMICVREKIEEVITELKLLRNFVYFISDRCTDPQSQHTFFTHVLVLAGYASIISWLNLPNYWNWNREDLISVVINASLKDIQKRILQPCSRKVYIDVLKSIKSGCHPNIQADYRVGFVETLIHHLKVLHPIMDEHKGAEDFKDRITMLNFLRDHFINLPREALEDFDTAIINVGLLVYSMDDSVAAVEESNQVTGVDIQSTQAQIYSFTRKCFCSNLPKIDGLGSLDIILEHLKEFLSRYSKSFSSIMSQLQEIQQQLECFQKQRDGFGSFAMQVIAKAYEVEYMVIGFVNKNIPEWCLFLWTPDILEEITLLIGKGVEIREKRVSDLVLHNTTDDASTHTSEFVRTTSMMSEQMVGFQEVIDTLIKQLISWSSKELDVISIVGMPGLGKTTLANKLFHDQLVVFHFDVRAQCCVSQVYTRKDLLLTILRGVEKDTVISDTLSENDLADKLRKLLMFKRYLILIDDVRETSAWDDLKLCFSNANNGSKIILTTRHGDVAYHAKVISDPHFLRMFTPEESWMLLKNKVFNTKSCPTVLEDVGQKIAQKCGGLPLSVVLIAEDEEIQVSKLTWLWTAEGLVKTHTEKLPEEIVEYYLKNLIGRNLIMVSKKSSDGKTKSCHIHDLLHDFCQKRAKLENFLQCIKGGNDHINPSFISPQKHSILRRVWLNFQGDNLAEWIPTFSDVQSFHLMKRRKIAPSSIHDASYTFNSFKFLRVLNLEFIVIDFLPETLTCLRYVAVRIADDSSLIFSSNLWTLETLIVNGMGGRVSLPETLWEMVKLRHLHVYNHGIFTRPNGLLNELRTLSSVWFYSVEDANNILAKTPNLQKLRCQVSASHNSSLAFNNLTKLEILKISRDFSSFSCKMMLPPTLKKLTLSNCYVDSINQVATLPKLVVLKLLDIQILGRAWKVTDGEFPHLKFLKLQRLYLQEWNVSDYAFPCLEHLVLRSLGCLKVIPPLFEDMPSLKSIQVIGCKESLVKSARDIRETQVGMQNGGFQLLIQKY